MNNSHKSIFVFLVCFFGSMIVNAQSKNIDTITVTATRSNIAIEDATLPVTIIGREQIEQSLARDISQLLRFEAGLDIGRNGGPGQTTSLFLEEQRAITLWFLLMECESILELLVVQPYKTSIQILSKESKL